MFLDPYAQFIIIRITIGIIEIVLLIIMILIQHGGGW